MGMSQEKCSSQEEEEELKSSKKKRSKKKSKKKKEPITIKYHHNVPDPSLCSMVLTSVSGHRLYCTALTVYEMRENDTPPKNDKEREEEGEDTKTKEPDQEIKNAKK